MAELIYHDPPDRTGVSPFDNAIHDVTEGKEALIDCPDISPDYLEGITAWAEDWFFLTDVGRGWVSTPRRIGSQFEHFSSNTATVFGT